MLVTRLGEVLKHPPPPDTFLVDASQLLYHITWPSSGTVGNLATVIETRIANYNMPETQVIIDWYNGISAKDHERQRRAGEGSTRYQITHNSRSNDEKQGQ